MCVTLLASMLANRSWFAAGDLRLGPCCPLPVAALGLGGLRCSCTRSDFRQVFLFVSLEWHWMCFLPPVSKNAYSPSESYLMSIWHNRLYLYSAAALVFGVWFSLKVALKRVSSCVWSYTCCHICISKCADLCADLCKAVHCSCFQTLEIPFLAWSSTCKDHLPLIGFCVHDQSQN